MDLERVIGFSKAESDLMKKVEVPIGQRISTNDLLTEIDGYDLIEEDKDTLKQRLFRVSQYRFRVKGHFDEDAPAMFERLFGRVPSGKVEVEAAPYHIIVTAQSYEDMKGIADETTAYAIMHPQHPALLIPDLKGLVEIRVKSTEMNGVNALLNAMGMGITDSAGDHEREHVRYKMIVNGGKSTHSKEWFQSNTPYLDCFESYQHWFSEKVKEEITGNLMGGSVNLVDALQAFKNYSTDAISKISDYRNKEGINADDVDRCITQYEKFHQEVGDTLRSLKQSFEGLGKNISYRQLGYVLANSSLRDFTQNFDAIVTEIGK